MAQAKILRDEAKDRNITEKAMAVARELGLEMLGVADFGTITPAEWKALVQLPAMKRFIGTLCEGYVTAIEAEEVATVKLGTLSGGYRPGGPDVDRSRQQTYARDKAIGRIKAEVYGAMLRGLAWQANREG